MASSSHAVIPTGQGEEEEVHVSGERGAWEGSTVTLEAIEKLRISRKIPLEVECRLPVGEIAPAPQEGEYVVFVAHFERGFALPASPFFRQMLDRLEIQPHHLPGNAITTIAGFVTCCEAYLGLLPSMEIWAKFFNLRPNVLPDKDLPAGSKQMTQCGSAMVMPRKNSIFPRIQGLESVKKWQRSYFYVKNPEGKVDYINLPKFVIGPPARRTH
jgi:hypothetical protein